MEVDTIKLQRLMKQAGYKSPVSTLTYTQAQSTKRYFESLSFGSTTNETYAIANLTDGREIVFCYSCEFEKAAKYLQDVLQTKIDSVNVVREEIVDKNEIYIKITSI